jgi:hypothetical protein
MLIKDHQDIPRPSHRCELHPALPALVVALGNDAQLVRAPDPDHRSIEAGTLGRGRRSMAVGRIALGGGSTVALPQAESLVLGRFLRCSETIETAVLREDAGVPLSTRRDVQQCFDL